ncbi:DUF1800 domain-containing protein [Bradyrhizobium sp. U87765 SZCCT0131]|uniref:DUF1800 domain-containing protein n=1 Tax=unclassified Bradyrhizobium TaxID=2631580 RepID=UPI001BA61C64|nr:MULTISPECIES: DUF1800 domain-containing protein [unclassified Bradyrhizobium]MBR1219063.1 DUF1800 domain-containing protein [Bradyrhizobium sp. U87765 SZCCT0131]MBR1261714.1 DUF1800 domain-containing protein [Bradyrhizobium sp. U87765 SZCCT0134]MBR1306433.1 DUF1800 domain-containing protein [Bradyrhizobium sp. U87765 SZCCT0110]MBR1317496.1 DUF1800 domain-containing protein [Bradyrhizobium sp. U87765 SZCCT0109]MBR1351198.1 DUF1800 domain-containing protein [Bradyrhizobium sp. U87765 SZCCT004
MTTPRRLSVTRLGLLLTAALVVTQPAASAAELSVRDVTLLDRLTFGITPSSAAQFQSMGAEQWLDQQLHPPASLQPAMPDAVKAQIEAMPDVHTLPFDTVLAFDQQSRTANQMTDPDQKKAAQQAFQQAMNDRGRQAAARTILRALYAPDQLRERMTWFWFNHFNVHLYKANLRVLVGDYVDNAIRPNALGHFRDLLSATLHHPAMLRYLDNADNAAGHINENYAREIMELHTMGVGSGYSQADVEQLAHILTGVGIDPKQEDPNVKPELRAQLVRQGLFEFNPMRHDYGDKTLLGHAIKGRGLAEVDDALDILCRHPATATRVSQKIATYFVGDTPPPALVQRMAQTFQKTDGDIAAVLATMVHAPEFIASLKPGAKFKDPVQYVMSAVRLAYDRKPILNTGPIQNWLNRLSEGLFNHQTPDGYPLTSEAWNGPGQMMLRFEVARQIGSGSAGLFKPEGANAVDQPGFPLLQNALYFNTLRHTLSTTTVAALDQAVSPQDWNTLFLSSPEFMR